MSKYYVGKMSVIDKCYLKVVRLVDWSGEVDGHTLIFVIEEHADDQLTMKVGLHIPDAPQAEDLVLPLHHVEIDCVQVGHHNGGVQDVVEADQDREDHVGKVNVTETKYG